MMATLKELEEKYLIGTSLTREVARIQGNNDQLLLSFSTGKDCLAAWLAVRDEFKEIIPFYLYLVPDLEFVDESLAFYEKMLGIHIVRLPAPQLYGMLNDLVFQPPERIETIFSCNFPKFGYPEVREILIEDYGLNKNIFYATGVRAPDSPMRMTALSKYGPITHSQNKFHPVWNWTKAKLVEELKKHKIKLPIDYKLFSRSFDGLGLRFLFQIKKHLPRDFEKIIQWFPLVELEISRYEFFLRNKERGRLRGLGADEQLVFQRLVDMKSDFDYWGGY